MFLNHKTRTGGGASDAEGLGRAPGVAFFPVEIEIGGRFHRLKNNSVAGMVQI
jgi:hypothetical protein